MIKNPGSAAADIKSGIAGLLNDNNLSGAQKAALDSVESGRITIPELYRDVLTCILEDMGASWQSGETPVWREHLLSALIRGVIEGMAPAVTQAAAPANGRTVVLACPPEEQHDLGLRMAADIFRLRGWTACFLGADAPENQIIEAARTLKADTVVLSAATHFHRLSLRELTGRVGQALPGVTVLVTGPAFKTEHEGWSDSEVLDPERLPDAPRDNG